MSEIALRVAVTGILNLASTMENGTQRKLSRNKKLRIRKESQILFRFQLFRRLVGENFHPALFNYGHVHFYALESIQNAVNSDDSEELLGHMTDKPMTNGRKYVDSGFVHDTMDNVNDEHYFLRAHFWPSMRNELPHNVVVVLSVISGARKKK